MLPIIKAPVGNRKVTRSLDPLCYPGTQGRKEKKKGKGCNTEKVRIDSHSKGQKGCWAQCSLLRPPLPPPAYIGLLSKIVIYAVF